MSTKKYYWLKLQKDFFKRHDIRIIEEMKNGKDYILFYMKLLVESISHDGHLRFSEAIPYNENMLATITNTNVDIVRSAVKIFTELGLMEVLDDGTFYMAEIQKMLGSETEWAGKKRIYRKRQELLGDNSGTKKDNVRQELELDSELDKDKDKTFVDDSIESRLAENLFSLIKGNNPKAKKPNLQSWAKNIDLMIRVDKRTPEEIKEVIEFCQNDDFWKANILSTAKLREKFDQLWLKKKNGKGNNNYGNKTVTIKGFEEREYQEDDIEDLYYDPEKEAL
jgi:predicted phage replisome organizer